MEFKVGDKVKMEGVIEANDSIDYPLKIICGDFSTIITRDGREFKNKGVVVQLVERAKVKVKKYLVVYKDIHGDFRISTDKYKSLEEFDDRIKRSAAISLIRESEEEFEQ